VTTKYVLQGLFCEFDTTNLALLPDRDESLFENGGIFARYTCWLRVLGREAAVVAVRSSVGL
jgi:hypothetical protein